jgi:hypothetical protein
MSTPVHTTAASLRVLLAGAIDYAGLFPPASLDMRTAVRNYSRYLSNTDYDTPRWNIQRWALGRFVLPAARLDEFNSEFLNAQENFASEPWHLSGIVSAAKVVSDLAAVDAFNRTARGAVIDSIEVPVGSSDEIDFVHKHQPAGTAVFCEIAPEGADQLLPILRQAGGPGLRVKLRTGGLVPSAIPSLQAVACFLARCAHFGVPFKATAGLHHPLRGMRPLTYQPDGPQAMMHGFLNVFTAAGIAWVAASGASAARPQSPTPSALLTTLSTCLADRERANWHFGDDALTWSGDEKPVRLDLDTLRTVRSQFALSFGSCSFEEPMSELHELDLL